MIWKVHHWQDGDFVHAQFDLGGDLEGPRAGGEPTHAKTYVKAGTLVLYPEAWEELRSTLSAGMLLTADGDKGPMTDLTIVEGRPS